MSAEKEQVMSGCSEINAWLENRFPQDRFPGVSFYYREPNEKILLHRWTIIFGTDRPTLRLGATEKVLSLPQILQLRLQELEKGGRGYRTPV